MTKKSLKITLFCVFVLFLFSSCVKKVGDCKIFPKIELESKKKNESDERNNESKEKIKNLIENRTTSAQVSCKF